MWPGAANLLFDPQLEIGLGSAMVCGPVGLYTHDVYSMLASALPKPD
jgi:hypothetical protein